MQSWNNHKIIIFLSVALSGGNDTIKKLHILLIKGNIKIDHQSNFKFY